MAKRGKRKKSDQIHYTQSEVVDNVLSKYKHIDLQRACLMRGMPFGDIGESYYFLTGYFSKNFDNPEDQALLDKFDNWRYKRLKDLGEDNPLFVRLGFTREVNEETGEILKRKRVKFVKKQRPKRKRNKKLGIFAGTKKELTMTSQGEGLSLEETTKVVLDKFPDAKEKSIRIWWKKAAKGNGGS